MTFSRATVCFPSQFEQSDLPSKHFSWPWSLSEKQPWDICCQYCISCLVTGKDITVEWEFLRLLPRITSENDDIPFACDVLGISECSVPCTLCFAPALLFFRDPWSRLINIQRRKRGVKKRWSQYIIYYVRIHNIPIIYIIFFISRRLWIDLSLVSAEIGKLFDSCVDILTMYSTRSIHKNINPNYPQTYTSIGKMPSLPF